MIIRAKFILAQILLYLKQILPIERILLIPF
ncbi:hypothetical protein NMYAN_60103 [Nitrosomonas nitrosa]|uniref:Uncharacterized protein n=1 Tax=Nitrosomonas nitrosa TaxID=52442 RepID=A0A8H8Z458_9PROT|nr:hypothetical protein NMYAN_60103 [Nitrosomonas nitrosa]